MVHVEWAPYRLRFRETAVTSRARMTEKETYFIKITDDALPGSAGIGECALFRGLSAEDVSLEEYEHRLADDCLRLARDGQMSDWSSIRFGQEMALEDLRNGGRRVFFDSPWTRGEGALQINGLVWMGDKPTMARRLREKLDAGFRCVKLKIGGIDFEEELELLRFIRSCHSQDEVELRLDANGAFSHGDALSRLERLAEFGVHSIEQPIRQGAPEVMARICHESPIPVALDEELIGMRTLKEKRELLSIVRPAYIILKPSLCGGFAEAREWISEGEKLGIGWWATSALESNVGLSAIAQWTSTLSPRLPQGLGTGQLYVNNFDSPLHLDGERLSYEPACAFPVPELEWRRVV